MSLNYSKWDKFVANLSDDEDQESSSSKPKVTRFNKPTSVTISKDGYREAKSSIPTSSSKSNTIGKIPKVNLMEIEETCPSIKSLSRNGSAFSTHCWSQSSEEAVVNVWVPTGTRAKKVHVSLSKGSNPLIKVAVDGKDVLTGTLAYNIVRDEDFDAGIDWQIKDYDSKRRRVILTFVKDCPIKGARIWWKMFLKGQKPISTETIEDRKPASKGNKKLWEEAHRMFRDKVSKMTPTYLDENGNVVNLDNKGEKKGI